MVKVNQKEMFQSSYEDLKSTIQEKTKEMISHLSSLDKNDLIEALNDVRQSLHEISPLRKEPVDFVRWVPQETVTANDYNPNSVAPPEMELLRTSIEADGYTQPIVGNQEGDKIVVVDGFHRHRVGKECPDIQTRIMGYLPVVQIRAEQVDLEHRMASTIRHNRARGKHKVEAMSDIVIELKRRNWSHDKISKQLGMDQDEILRLCQITGLQEIFSDPQFSQAWEAEGQVSIEDFEDIKGAVSDYQDDDTEVRTVNTNDESRVFHTFYDWECHKAGFYETKPPKGMTAEQCKKAYRDFLSDLEKFESALRGVITEWKNSCEHYLTNSSMNRIAWLGQASMCYATGVPAEFRGGFGLLTAEMQKAADEMALKYLNIWLSNNGRPELTMDEAITERQSDIY